jgi:hypothetical protein
LKDRYKLRITEIAIAPGGYVGAHNHLGPRGPTDDGWRDGIYPARQDCDLSGW